MLNPLEAKIRERIQPSRNGKSTEPAPPQAKTPPVTGPIVTCLATVTSERVRWLWRDRIPMGRITVLAGNPGDGKTFMTMDIASRVSTGTDFPDGTPCEQGGVLVISAEDDPADTIKPRLEACEADCDHVHVLTGIRYLAEKNTIAETVFTLANMAELETALQKISNCKLVIVDPIGSYTGAKISNNADNEVRSVLAPLAALAKKYDVAVLLVCHTRKSTGDSADDTVMGSRAFVGLARAVWHLKRDPQNTERRLLLAGKCNLAKSRDGLAFGIEGNPARPVWEPEPVTATASEIMFAATKQANDARKAGRPGDERNDAADWLCETLKDGPVTVDDLKEKAKQDGHKWRTVERAKAEIGAKSAKSFGGKARWVMPTHENDDDANQPPTLPEIAPTPNNCGGIGDCGGIEQNTGKTQHFENGNCGVIGARSNPAKTLHAGEGFGGNGEIDDDEPFPDVSDGLFGDTSDPRRNLR